MPEICITNMHDKIIVATSPKSLLESILQSHTDWLHSCGGKGRCTTCKAIIIEGEKNLTPQTAAEKKYQALNQLADNERLACQCAVRGNIKIAVPDENKMPHIDYSV
ncbi:MAG: (2Fe-2S)-binding protein [Bernardetiaceae bacterium]|nr:(2Fe-2S)-binding protein [Bernardetiaceae bacterium]